MTPLLVQELWRLAAFLVPALVLGWYYGYAILWFAAALGAYLLWHVVNGARVLRWAQGGLGGAPPICGGVWEELCVYLARVRRRDEKRQRRLIARLVRFQEATQALPDAMVLLDREGNIRWCNDAAQDLLGLDKTNDVGQRMLNLVRVPALVEYMSRDSRSDGVLVASPTKPGVLLAIRVVWYAGDQRLLIGEDVTHLQQVEKMRRDFVANVSHEMRTPLTVINGYLETLIDEAPDVKPEWQPILGQMHEQADRMQNLVGDLLLLARLESSERVASRTAVNMPRLLGVLQDEAAVLAAKRGQTIVFDIQADLWLYGQESELRSVFTNLISNAVRYTPQGGRIEVRWYADQSGAHFSVRDSGIGIAPEHLPRLTERFYRVDVARSRHTGGTGLGLAIVKHVLQRHEGKLHVESEPGKGSLFRSAFPADRIAAPQRELAGVDHPP